MNSFAPLLFFLLAMILIANAAGSVRLKTGDYQTVWKNNYKLKKLRHDLGEYEDYVYNDKGNTAISKSAQNDMNKSQGILKNAIRSVNQANKHQVTQPAATEKESAMIDKTSENIKIMRNKEFSKAAANKLQQQRSQNEKKMHSMLKTMQRRSNQLFAPLSSKPKKTYSTTKTNAYQQQQQGAQKVNSELRDIEYELGML